ncbi:DUF1189 family protein [Macrococcus sp. DPC7161]|uniref:DUF1189 family protein n=1 Tax=Macrococcus sp. DPC7161 TaxID=2507060 RepID=UPI00100AAA3D|nr:DUF1189 family protein [Macrococcus sp. DPC7161]RXK19370.1 DUF1189 domain-containing protein [Macrococcus sp. DPC7161]
MNYLKLLKRVFKHPKQYPMLRTAKLRYVFLHLLILSCILATTPMSTYKYGIDMLKSISNDKNAIPEFNIVSNELKLDNINTQKNNEYKNQINYINKNILFIEANDNETIEAISYLKPDITFSKHNIYLSESVKIPYSNLPMITDKKSLIQMIDIFSKSSFFYLALIYLILVMIQMVSIIFKTIFITSIAYVFAIIMHRKFKYMNTLKISTFLLTIPTFIMFLGNISLNPLFIVLSWCIIVMLMSLLIYYLPKAKPIHK